MSVAEDEDDDIVLRTAVKSPKPRRRRFIAMILAMLLQYAIVATLISLPFAGLLHYLVAPQLIATFRTIAAGLSH
jgi:hypothetical protein